uniref:F-box/kelch-repeat protein At3g06240-like n=1 Tax=Erigeron canadensis TaxID=72917 RepID=UPI001CB8C8AA|nr:F-box/kelch-repeat protein At3g06240-like [Erigeron canadensis]
MSSEKVGVVVLGDILEQILVRLDLKDLIQCKRVCTSWHSLVSSSRFAISVFISNKQNTSNNKRQRICINEDRLRKNLVGSSNGLVCIFTRNAEIVVANPLTGELKKLKNPELKKLENPRHGVRSLCNNLWFLGGFGYDSWSDDYKVILGTRQYDADFMRFHVLSLKSNVWKIAGEAKCSFICISRYPYSYNKKDTCGILCNGAIHWFVLDQHKNPMILSFDLSTEEFKEIPQPDDPSYKYTAHTNYRLGMVEESLCIYNDHLPNCAKLVKTRSCPKWVMKKYNGKQGWELLPHHAQWDNDVALRLKLGIFFNSVKKSFFHERKQCVHKTSEYISAPMYVQSLVSPQVNERPKSPVSPGGAKSLLYHHVSERSMSNVSGHVIGGLKRKRHTQNGYQER